MFWRLIVLVAALTGGALAAVPVGFFLYFYVTNLAAIPLTLAVGAIFSATAAFWAGELLAPDRGRLFAVVGVALAVAGVWSAVTLALPVGVLQELGILDLNVILAGLAIVAVASAAATWLLRVPAEGSGLASASSSRSWSA